VGVSRDCPTFLGTPYYLMNGKSYGFQTWPVRSEGPSELKPIEIFGEKGAWAYPGTARFFGLPPIISGTGKATNFKFCMYIYRLNRNKSPLKVFRAPIHRAHRAVIFATAQFSCYSSFYAFYSISSKAAASEAAADSNVAVDCPRPHCRCCCCCAAVDMKL